MGPVQHDPLISSLMVPKASWSDTGHKHQYKPAADSWTMDPDMAFGSNLGPDNILPLGGNAGNSGQDSSGSSLAPRHHKGLRLQPQPWASIEPLVAIGDSDANLNLSVYPDPGILTALGGNRSHTRTNPDPGLNRVTDPDTALRSSPGWQICMPLLWHGPQTPTRLWS